MDGVLNNIYQVVTVQTDNITVNGSGDNYSTIDTDLCSNAFPKASVYLQGLRYNIVEGVFLFICGILTVITCVLYASELRSKQYRYKTPGKRLKTLLLLGIYPLTSFMACFALFVPRSTVLVDFIASCYLSLCIYVFITILIQYYGNTEIMMQTLSEDKVSIRTPPCCCCFCLPTVKVNRRSVGVLKMLIMQVAVLQPLFLFLKAVMWSDDNASVNAATPDSPTFYTNLLSGVSTLLALYSLSVSVGASQKFLSKHRINLKFKLLQLVLLSTNLQQTIFGVFLKFNLPPCNGAYGSKVTASVYHHMMIIGEMFILAALARFVYRRSESRNLNEVQTGSSVEYGSTSSPADSTKLQPADVM